MTLQTSIKKLVSQPIAWIAASLSVVGASILLGAVYHSRYVRYLADDYCTASVVQSLGWIAAQTDWYQQWTGRFSFVAIISALELMGPMVAPWLPILVSLLWLVGLVWFGSRLGQMVGLRHSWLLALPLSVLTLAMYIITNPHPGQAFFWFTGNVTYTLPLVICTYAAVMGLYLIRQAIQVKYSLKEFWRSWYVRLAVVFSSLLLFIASGLNETHTVAQLLVIALMGLVLVMLSLSSRGHLKCLGRILGLWLLVTVAGFFIMSQAPGNDVRSASYPPSPTIEDTLNQSLFAVNTYLITDWSYAWFIYLMVAAVVLLSLSPRLKAPARPATDLAYGAVRSSVLIGLIAYGLIVVHYAPSYYVQHYPTEPRTFAAASFILAIAAILIGWQISHLIRPLIHSSRPSVSTFTTLILVLAGAILVGKLYLSQHSIVWQQVNQMQATWQSYAQSWDQRHNDLQERARDGQTTAIIERLGQTYGLEDISTQAEHWINQCVAKYYGLNQITTEK